MFNKISQSEKLWLTHACACVHRGYIHFLMFKNSCHIFVGFYYETVSINVMQNSILIISVIYYVALSFNHIQNKFSDAA